MRRYLLKVVKAAMVSTEIVVDADSFELATKKARMVSSGKDSSTPAPTDWVIGEDAPGGGMWEFEPLLVTELEDEVAPAE